VKIYNAKEELLDHYNLKLGIRTVTWDKNNLYINEEPFYLKGVGRHEDSEVI
jgi:beta-glucuronidase